MSEAKGRKKRHRSPEGDEGARRSRVAWLACACGSLALLLQLHQLYDVHSLRESVQAACVETNNWSYIKARINHELGRQIESYMNKRNSVIKSRVRRDAIQKSPAEEEAAAPHVEFFNPKLRPELEAKDALERARTGLEGAAPGGDPWVWLTSYSRVPYTVVQGFCKATQEYCPPGVAGPPGRAGASGPRGERGERGAPGAAGKPGALGPVGPVGPKGERGWPGNPGLDGRDGVPGEPGLDGVSGRSGADGAPGKDGAHGKDGRPGKDGKNGQDGRKAGAVGPAGARGPEGRRGLPGPKGARGADGKDGQPGNPGVTAWAYNDNKSFLIPPSFPQDHRYTQPVIVRERENLRLRCVAQGKPEPAVEWRRRDGRPIVQGTWRDPLLPGLLLNITQVHRRHAGLYSCLANNGVPPPANQTFGVEVHFSPYIRVRNHIVTVYNGSTARLECEVEAWPEPILGWELDDGTPLEGYRYRSDILPTEERWRWLMRLNLTAVTPRDYGKYRCYAKNELRSQPTRGELIIEAPDPRRVIPHAGATGGGAEYGAPPPPLVAYDELCERAACPTCRVCGPELSVADLLDHLVVTEIPVNATRRGIQRRTLYCKLYAIGKPVYHQFTDSHYGAWLRDPAPRTEQQGEKLWTTNESHPFYLLEFANKANFRKNIPTKVYKLPKPFYGNGHVIFNGSFYYQNAAASGGGGNVTRFALAAEAAAGTLALPAAGGALYATAHKAVDFSVDDNGLWAIYSLAHSNNTAVAKFGFDDMTLQYVWNISVNHRRVGEMFIACGVLYALDSASERDTKVRLAIDLYRNELMVVSLNFTNPFRKTTALSYDHRHKELYSWDRGNQLTYPVRYHESLDTSSPVEVPGDDF